MLTRLLTIICMLLLPSIAAADEVVRVGALLSLSGEYAPIGAEIQRGIELAQKERGEQTPSVTVTFEDIQTINPRAAISAAQKLLTSSSIDISLSAYASESEPLGPLFQSRRTPLLVLWDSTEQLLNTGDYIFSNGFSTEAAGQRGADLSRSKLNLARIAIISQLDGWSSTFAQAFEERFKQLGGEVISHQELDPSVTDFRTAILRALSGRPDGLVFPLVVNPAAFLQQAQQAKVSIPLISGDTMILPGLLETAGRAAEGVYYTAIFTDREDTLQELHTKHFGERSADVVSLSFGYDGMQTVYQAVKIANEKNITITEALTEVLGPDRSANRVTALYRIVDGQRMRID